MESSNGTSEHSKEAPRSDTHLLTNGTTNGEDTHEEDQNGGGVFQISVKLPHSPYKIQVMVSSQEQLQDVRQSIVETPDTFQYTCFHLEHNGQRINDYVELSEVEGLKADSEVTLMEDPYTEKEARVHIVRIRDLLGAAGDRVDSLQGISAGLSLHDAVASLEQQKESNEKKNNNSTPQQHPLSGYDPNAPGSLNTILLPTETPAPKTIKSISLSPWNPPPYHLRQQGHLLYLQLTTNEGELHQITAHVSGFYVNKCSNAKFDPYPRSAPKNFRAHSLLNLISQLSPSFQASFQELQESNNKKDLLTTFPFQNSIPNSPWLVSLCLAGLNAHQSDVTRSQENYLISGIDNAETLRDWNEEFQTTRELPREKVQDRVFRERLTSKLFADYNDAAARGAVLVARGEVAPLNPTEGRDAQIFVYNNIFYSFGADGVGTFASEGGDEAARVAVGKDVMGIRAVNQLDIPSLFTPGTVVVDYLGKRIVGQSIVPGIFKQREPGEHQIDYGGVEGKDVVAEHPDFVPVFEKLSKALHVKRHPVWDKDGKRHDLEGSVETKGLLGTDGRKYVVDLYRIAPLDILWAEDDISSGESYPHRMSILRLELVESYWRSKMSQYVQEELERRRNANKSDAAVTNSQENTPTDEESNSEAAESKQEGTDQERIDLSGFVLALNPDAFSGQIPQTDEEKTQWANDEKEVRSACEYLRTKIIPELLQDLHDGDVGFPMDGQSLAQLLHKRGINIRYLGKLAEISKQKGHRLQALTTLVVQEMITRAFKHIINRYLCHIPPIFAASCISHLLNCLVGAEFNPSPQPDVDESLRPLYPEGDFSFEKVTVSSLRRDIEKQVQMRYRFTLDLDWSGRLRHTQLLRDVSVKLGLQLGARQFTFSSAQITDQETVVAVNGVKVHSTDETGKKKKKKCSDSPSPTRLASEIKSATSFVPDDIVNIVPLIKDAAPRSALAEEALEAGRISLAQGQKQLGQELILESLSLHEQIYGILHPEVAKLYHQLSMLYYQNDEKDAAVELARKAVIVTERTMGVDSADTILSYLNLSLFEHAIGNTNMALVYVKHAMDLWKIIYGPNHPDSITTMNNAAVMLQHLKQYPDSRKWFESSLSVCEALFGRQSINTATILFQLAQALALDQDSKAAVNRMRDAYNIFLNELGPEDRNTKEAESWLEQLTQNAVSIAKHAKDIQARRLRRANLSTRVSLGTRPQPQVGGTGPVPLTEGHAGNSQLDTRSIDDLLKFIEGGDSNSARSKKRGTANPKLRSSRKAVA